MAWQGILGKYDEYYKLHGDMWGANNDAEWYTAEGFANMGSAAVHATTSALGGASLMPPDNQPGHDAKIAAIYAVAAIKKDCDGTNEPLKHAKALIETAFDKADIALADIVSIKLTFFL